MGQREDVRLSPELWRVRRLTESKTPFRISGLNFLPCEDQPLFKLGLSCTGIPTFFIATWGSTASYLTAWRMD